MGTYGSTCVDMDQYGVIWVHMSPYMSIWVHVGPIWDHICPYGSMSVPYGTIWAHMGPYKSIWVHMGPWPGVGRPGRQWLAGVAEGNSCQRFGLTFIDESA